MLLFLFFASLWQSHYTLQKMVPESTVMFITKIGQKKKERQLYCLYKLVYADLLTLMYCIFKEETIPLHVI